MKTNNKKMSPAKMLKAFLADPKAIIVIAFSGGKDSIACFLHLVFDWKIPLERIELWHHEIDGGGEQLFDWPCTISYCQAFADAFNVPLLFSYRGGGILREMYRTNETSQSVFYQDKVGGDYIELLSDQADRYHTTRRKFPAVSGNLQTRWCSGKVKIDVMNRAINHRWKNGEKIIVITGERKQESPKRSTYKTVDFHTCHTGIRSVIHWRNILSWNEKRVWDIMEEHGIQPHPCYMLGYSRCSCRTCIFLDSDGWASTAELQPNVVDRIDGIEKDFNFTLYNNMDINQKINKGNSFINPAMKKRWMKEANGKFVSPIFIKNWKLPQGAFSKSRSGAL